MAEVLANQTVRAENYIQQEDERVCGICLERITQLNDVRKLECDHLFCMDCLKKSTKHEDTAKCAVCGAVFDSDLQNLKVEHHTDDSTHLDDKSVYTIETHRCPVHTREITTMGCRDCLSVFCCECLNENMLCPYYEMEGLHQLCSFGSLPDCFNDKMDEQKMLIHRMKFKLEDCDKQLLNTCDNLEDNGRDVFDQITENPDEDDDLARTVKDYLISIRAKRDKCSDVIMEQINQLETLTKEKERMMSELKPKDFKSQVVKFTKEVDKILKNDLPEFRINVLTLYKGITGFKLQHDDFTLDYEFEMTSLEKPEKSTDYPMAFRISNIYVHDQWGMESGPKHPEYYKMSSYGYASSTKLIQPWFIERQHTRIVFAYPIQSFVEDTKYIFVFTRHSVSGRYGWPVRTLFRWNKVSEQISVVFRTTQCVREMTLSDEYVHFDGDYGRMWKVRKEFEPSYYHYSVLTENPESNYSYGLYRD